MLIMQNSGYLGFTVMQVLQKYGGKWQTFLYEQLIFMCYLLMQQFADFFNTFGIAFDSNRFMVKRFKRLNI